MTATDPTRRCYGRFEIRPGERQLLVDGQPARLGARAFDVLLTLAERRDRLVTKNELLDTVWPNLVVEENNLQVHISALRKLLGPDTITTIPGRGYRFTSTLNEGAIGPKSAAASDTDRVEETAGRLTNLPKELSTLYGREQDLVALRELIWSHRLVTVVGTGGIGKTRLAQAAAFEQQAAFVNGVWMVEFAPVSDPALVLVTVARTLGVPLDAQATAEHFAERIADRQMLIVLDNCEHLVDGVAKVAAALVRAAPQIRLLATSQETLKLPQEQVYRLGTLAVPDETTIDGAGDAGAVSLFEARARAVQPRFAIDADNRGVVIEICRRLDGIALAIELAAARLPLLGLDGLRRRLDDRFRLLSSGTRLAPRRQQTLRAALEWSHGLLNASEQIVFRRLGVFAGSFALAAAQRVAADAEHDEWSVLDHLGALVDKSLVIIEPDAEPRYRLLETGRAFALEQLQAAGETVAVARTHAAALLEVLNRAHERQWTESSEALLPALLPDVDNLRAALAWAAGPDGDANTVVALTGSAWWLWKPARLVAEGVRRCLVAIDHIDEATPPALQALLLYGYASLSHQFAADRELEALHRAADLYRALGDRRGLYRTLCLLSQKQAWRYDLPAAERAADEAEQLLDESWPPVMREGLLTARTYCLEAAGRPAAGQPLMEELVALMRTLGDARKLDFALMQLAESLFVQGKAVEAIRVRREVVERIGHRRVDYAATNLGNLSAALTYLGEVDEASRFAREAVPGLRSDDRLSSFADHFALLACRRGRFASAARVLGHADAGYRSSGFGRELSEQRAFDMTLKLLRKALPPDELDRLLAEGALLTDEEATRVALGE